MRWKIRKNQWSQVLMSERDHATFYTNVLEVRMKNIVEVMWQALLPIHIEFLWDCFLLVCNMSIRSQATHKSCVVKLNRYENLILLKIIDTLNLITLYIIIYDYVREQVEGKKMYKNESQERWLLIKRRQ